jgi:anti-sigma factor RsiW
MSQRPEHLPRSDDAAAYVLGALDEAEAAEFLEHTEDCAICASELERLRATAAVLPLAAPQLEAPRATRSRPEPRLGEARTGVVSSSSSPVPVDWRSASRSAHSCSPRATRARP